MASDPVFRAALPEWLHKALAEESDKPVDITSLVVEFAWSLDPLTSAHNQIARLPEGMPLPWRLVGECSVSASVLRVLRVLAADPKLVRLLRERDAAFVEGATLKPRAMPVLLGVAAASAVRLRAGVVSNAVARRIEGVRRSERQRSDDGSPSGLSLRSPSLGGKPTLSPLPTDLSAG